MGLESILKKKSGKIGVGQPYGFFLFLLYITIVVFTSYLLNFLGFQAVKNSFMNGEDADSDTQGRLIIMCIFTYTLGFIGPIIHYYKVDFESHVYMYLCFFVMAILQIICSCIFLSYKGKIQEKESIIKNRDPPVEDFKEVDFDLIIANLVISLIYSILIVIIMIAIYKFSEKNKQQYNF